MSTSAVVAGINPQQNMYHPDAALFHTLFPFHLVLDEGLRVVQVRSKMNNPSEFQSLSSWIFANSVRMSLCCWIHGSDSHSL